MGAALALATEPGGGTAVEVERHNRQVEACLPMVVHLARRLSGRGVEVEELESIGTVALCQVAADGFDPTRRVKLASFAYWRVRGAMLL